MAKQDEQRISQTPLWRDFNHDTRLALHTLHGSLQLAKKEASPTQLAQLRIADRCSAVVLQLLEAYESANHSLPQTPSVLPSNTGAAAIGMPVPAAGDLDLPSIPVSEFEKFENLMQTGQLLKIGEWVADLGEIFPELETVADALDFYAYSADLPSLQTVLDRWRQQLA